MTKLSAMVNKERIFAALMAGVALFGAYVAQMSSNTSVLWIYYQPKAPESLIKK